MGLLDGIAGAVVSNMLKGEQGGLANIAMEVLNQKGGLGGILEMFQQNGLADQAASWVGKGDNLPLSADQLSSVFGENMLADLAGKAGVTPDILSGQLADKLPGLIDQLTPDGEVNDNSADLLGTVLGMLK